MKNSLPKKNTVVFFVLLLILSACKKETVAEPCVADSRLYERSDFPIGAALNFDSLHNNSVYNTIAVEQFNSVTAENIFKADRLHPLRYTFDWIKADQLVGYAEFHGKRMHGHTLIWHEQLPGWIRTFEGGKEEWEELFRLHIQTIVSHFKGKVKSWDVVNEAFNEDGTLRNTIWAEKLGPSYIEKAFRYANEADNAALLFYNDYLLEMNPLKRKAVLTYLNDLRNKGLKVDGIGLQMHISIHYPEKAQMADAFKEIADAGYQVHLSELDISVNPFSKDVQPDSDLFNKQAEVLAALVEHYKNVPAHLRYGITFWGVGDKDSWIPHYFHRKDYPLLFDGDYKPKPAYCRLKECL